MLLCCYLLCIFILYNVCLEKGSDQLILKPYKLSIYPSLHNQLIRPYRGTHCCLWSNPRNTIKTLCPCTYNLSDSLPGDGTTTSFGPQSSFWAAHHAGGCSSGGPGGRSQQCSSPIRGETSKITAFFYWFSIPLSPSLRHLFIFILKKYPKIEKKGNFRSICMRPPKNKNVFFAYPFNRINILV